MWDQNWRSHLFEPWWIHSQRSRMISGQAEFEILVLTEFSIFLHAVSDNRLQIVLSRMYQNIGIVSCEIRVVLNSQCVIIGRLFTLALTQFSIFLYAVSDKRLQIVLSLRYQNLRIVWCKLRKLVIRALANSLSAMHDNYTSITHPILIRSYWKFVGTSITCIQSIYDACI